MSRADPSRSAVTKTRPAGRQPDSSQRGSPREVPSVCEALAGALADDVAFPFRHQHHHLNDEPPAGRGGVHAQVERHQTPAQVASPNHQLSEVKDGTAEPVQLRHARTSPWPWSTRANAWANAGRFRMLLPDAPASLSSPTTSHAPTLRLGPKLAFLGRQPRPAVGLLPGADPGVEHDPGRPGQVPLRLRHTPDRTLNGRTTYKRRHPATRPCAGTGLGSQPSNPPDPQNNPHSTALAGGPAAWGYVHTVSSNAVNDEKCDESSRR